ncbi:alpha/beta hydrolase [Dactylosporangium siamense]|uniref:Alpha/beta hydrolase n=1 Tax=Dactylosporangium siamense TaxID=685454 RepID=A0A919PIA7_9ACTN|nr:alpha/beta hydrolase [Dactylosporangium siamense]GIG43922.1 alpha/beta hydrolase [Dactylosporangium siamense]
MTAPLGIRLLQTLRKEPDWSTMPDDELAAFREAENRRRASTLIRVVTGFPSRGVTIGWEPFPLPDRSLQVRVYRPAQTHARLPLVVHVHGGGFVGTAVQSDWVNSHLAAQLPAVVVSVEHRLLAPGVPLSAAVDDGWDVLRHVVANPARWGIDPARVAVFGESAGSVVAALSAIRARDSDLALRAQVLVNPCVDLTTTAFDYASMREHADSPTLTVPQLHLFRRLAVPSGTDARAVSPLHADSLSDLPPALVVVPTLDPVADHGRAYARRLRDAGTTVQLTEHPGATHAFLSMPGVVPHAKAARAEITGFLHGRLTA